MDSTQRSALRHIKFSLLLFSLLCSTNHNALAEMDPEIAELLEIYGSEEIISIATGNAKPIYAAPSVASVITAKQIKQMAARTLDDILETVPGLHVAPSSINRMDSIYSIRGIHTGTNPHVLLLRDGIPVQWVTLGNRPILFKLPVHNIERVEVVRGPGSALYGADAYSGVVNVITKDSDSIGSGEVGTKTGSFDYYEAWFQKSLKNENWNSTFSLNYQHSNGDAGRILENDLQTSLDTAFSTSASLSPGSLNTLYEVLNTDIKIENKNWYSNFWSWSNRDAGNGAGGALALDPTNQENGEIYRLDIGYNDNFFSNHTYLNSHISYTRYKIESKFTLLPPGATVPIGADGNLNFVSPSGVVNFPNGLIGAPGGEHDDSQFDLSIEHKGLLDHDLRFAIGARQQSATPTEQKNFGPGVIDGSSLPSLPSVAIIDGELSDVTGTAGIYLPNLTRDIYYISAQDIWQFASDWELTASIRYDDYSDFGDTLNPRAALVWATSLHLTTKFLYGSAFRAPSFGELAYINNPVALGNMDLDPETIDTYEIVFNYRPSPNFNTALSFFRYKAKDLIEFVANGDGNSSAQNIRNQNGKGFEWEATWKYNNDLSLSANYAYQNSSDNATGDTIPEAPRRQFFNEINFDLNDFWETNAELHWVSSRYRSSNDTRSPIKDYFLINANVTRKDIMNGLDGTIAIRNILNKEDRHYPSNGTINSDFPIEGRSAYVEFNYSF